MRYRINFVANFHKDVEAKDVAEAKMMANVLRVKSGRQGLPADAECYWNTIEQLSSENDD